MRVALIGATEAREDIDALATHLVQRGFDVVTTWHRQRVAKYPRSFDDREAALAINVAALDAADAIVMVAPDGTKPRSAFAELGYAIAKGKPVVWLAGRQQNTRCMFDAHDLVAIIDNADIGRAIYPATAGVVEALKLIARRAA
jgi:nucleoside 2-deoxyribosyltransferase